MTTTHTPEELAALVAAAPPANADQDHLREEIEHQDTEAAFEALAARYAPSATGDALHAFESQLVARAIARTAPQRLA